jgi:glycosyltransferase involved in cell wall biosynthesis/predicted O-methyltransferase YrrM
MTVMFSFSHFSGRIVQVIQALDVADAVSDQVVKLDHIFREKFGLKSEIYAAGFHPERQSIGKHVDLMELDERDILIYHYSGYAKESAAKVTPQKAVKILHYHNITPHEFFPLDSQLYHLCKQGRQELTEIVDKFDFFTGDSQYNVDELVSLGVLRDKTLVLPIITDAERITHARSRKPASDVLFVGRIVENKRQDKIVEAYARLLANGNRLGNLVLVGNVDCDSPFYRHLTDTVQKLNLQKRVLITGKIGEQELHEIYSQAGLFLSMSEHEGFGVPLLEACRYDIPVLALARGAVPETLRQSPGLFYNENELDELVDRLGSDPSFRDRLVSQQRRILADHNTEVQNQITTLLNRLIPQPGTFNSVSIVICTYNRGDLLERALDYLDQQYDSRFEVIVVDGPSNDNTVDVIQKRSNRIKLAQNPTRNLSISRNIGIRLAAGEIVAFIDDDAIAFNDWVGTLLSEYNSVPRLVAGIGGITYAAGTLEFQADDILIDTYGRGWFNQSGEEKLRPDRFRTLLGTNSSFRRDVLLEVGGFDEEYDYFLDESDVCLRVLQAGYKLHHSRQLYLRHEVARSENRVDKYRYNWFSISKNTAYFAIRFNNGNRDAIISRIRDQLQADRIAHLKRGHSAGLISQRECREMSAEVWRGMDQGIRDVESPRCLLIDVDAPPAFCRYLDQPHTFTPLHVVLVTKEFPPFTPSGGVGTLYYHLANELLLMGHRVSVIAQGPENELHHRGRFTLHRLPFVATENFCTGSTIAENNLNWSLCVAKKIMDIHSSEPISVVDTSVWDTELYAFAVYRTKVRIPIVMRLVTPFAVACESNNWQIPHFEKELLMALEREVVAMSDCVIPISRSIEETFTKRYDLVRDSRWRVLPAGIAYWPAYMPTYDLDQGYDDVTQWPEIAAAKQESRFIFLFLSRLEIRKGVDILIAAIRRFITQKGMANNCLFVLAGRDCMGIDKYLSSDETRAFKECVLVMGEVSVVDREKLYSASDAVVFPSRYESFGLVPLEAFVYGKPVIGSNVGAIPEVVEHNQSGLLFEDGNPDALADCFSRLLTDQELYRRLADGARKRVRELSSAKMAQETDIVYRSSVGTTRHKPSTAEPKDPMEIGPSRFSVIYTAPALMTLSERVILYSIVFGLQPRRCLEIGTNKAGSSLIMSAALDDIGAGHLVCVDFDPQISSEHWQQLVHHATLLKGTSPDILGQALEAAGGKFDFALIDGDHELPGVIRDIEGVLPLLEDEAYIMFHDAHYYQVSQGIDQMLFKYKDRLTDCGIISVEQTPENRVENGHPVIWGGLRMVRHRAGVSSATHRGS